jgi:hypothetical protein
VDRFREGVGFGHGVTIAAFYTFSRKKSATLKSKYDSIRLRNQSKKIHVDVRDFFSQQKLHKIKMHIKQNNTTKAPNTSKKTSTYKANPMNLNATHITTQTTAQVQ